MVAKFDVNTGGWGWDYWMLPRVYVGPPAGRATLSAGAAVPISPSQTHHLVNGVRIFKERRRRCWGLYSYGMSMDRPYLS
jgi:hypothetical protein